MNKKAILLARKEQADGHELKDNQLKLIVNEYAKKIVLPKKINKTQIILFPVGLIGSGKTTVVKIISKKLNLLRISTDEIREILKRRGFNYDRTKEIAFILVEKYLSKKYSVAIDADCIEPLVKEYAAKIKKEKNIIPIWIHIKTPEKYILARMRKNKLGIFFKDSDLAIISYKRRKPLHQKYIKKIKFDYIFSSFNKNVEKQVANFIKKLKLLNKNI